MKSKMDENLSFNKFISKAFMLCLVLLMPFVGFSQSEIEKDKVKVEAISIEVTIDSVEELESTFKEQDLEELFKMIDADGDVTFTLNCSFEEAKDKLKGHLTYTIKGKANEKEKLFHDIKKAKATALKFYNLKNRK